MDYIKCACAECSQNIEFPSELAGQQINCPSCSCLLLLPQPEPDERTGLWNRLLTSFEEARDKSRHRKKFAEELLTAVGDAVLTVEEKERLSAMEAEFEFSDADTLKQRKKAYAAALAAAKLQGNFSLAVERNLRDIQRFLKLPDSEVLPIISEIQRCRYLHEVRSGNIAPIQVSNMVFAIGEQAYWVEPGTLYEERVISRGYRGGSTGVSVRVMKGVSVRIGNHKGQLVTQTGTVPVSTGRMILTDRRIVFQGDRKSFHSSYDKLIEAQPFADGIRFCEANKEKPRLIKFAQNNGQMVGEVLSGLLSRRTCSQT